MKPTSEQVERVMIRCQRCGHTWPMPLIDGALILNPVHHVCADCDWAEPMTADLAPLEDVVWKSEVTEIRMFPCWWRDKDLGGIGFAVTAITQSSVTDEIVEDTIDAAIRKAVANAKDAS